MSSTSESKVVFQIAHADESAIKQISIWIKEAYPQSIIYSATNGSEAIQKMRNVAPNVLVTALELARLSGEDLIQDALREKNLSNTAIVVLSTVPEKDCHIDEVATGRVQFVMEPFKKETFSEAVNKGLIAMSSTSVSFTLKTLKQGEILFREAEKAKSAYLVKSGKLRAYHTKQDEQVVLGEIQSGEFVGEMALLNGEQRSATVEALENCELIEIPLGSLDVLVFSKPAWSKALVKTLSKRLRVANQR